MKCRPKIAGLSAGACGQTSTAWRAAERVAASDEHAYIYTSALAAIIVPAGHLLAQRSSTRLFGRPANTMRKLWPNNRPDTGDAASTLRRQFGRRWRGIAER